MRVDDLTARWGAGGVVVLDGALGTELQRRGVDTRLPLWSARALLEAPEIVQAIHREYIQAGADIITANTFRTQRRTLAREGMAERARELTRLAVELARQAREETGGEALVAGSMAPLEDCYHPERVPGEDELKAEHGDMAESLAEAGVDLILVESMGTLEESVAASKAARQSGLPFMSSALPRIDGNFLSRQSTIMMAQLVIPDRPLALLLNCANHRFVLRGIERLKKAASIVGVPNLPVGGYASLGAPDEEKGWQFTDEMPPETYAYYVRDWIKHGARVVGGCCGTTPDHIRELVRVFKPPS